MFLNGVSHYSEQWLVTQAPKVGYSKNDLKFSQRNDPMYNKINKADTTHCISSIKTMQALTLTTCTALGKSLSLPGSQLPYSEMGHLPLLTVNKIKD